MLIDEQEVQVNCSQCFEFIPDNNTTDKEVDDKDVKTKENALDAAPMMLDKIGAG